MRNRRTRELAAQSNQGPLSDTEALYSQMSQGMHIQDVNNEEDMEVTEDFLMFMAQSEKHREQWKVSKSSLKAQGGTLTLVEEPSNYPKVSTLFAQWIV